MKNYNILKAAALSELLDKIPLPENAPLASFFNPILGDTHKDYQLQQAAQPSPAYLERANKKNLLGKYYSDKMTQDYAVNPSEGDKGVPAKALPVADQNSAPQYAAPAQPAYPTSAPVKPKVDLNALFKEHHATSFNPKSSMDIGKMKKLKAKYGY